MKRKSRNPDNQLESARDQLLSSLATRGIASDRVLSAIADIPRESFVAPELRSHAYDDNALPTRFGQTISQPTVVAMMTSALDLTGNEHVLEIGTGSGYQAAVISRLARSCVSVELHADLAEQAQRVLDEIGVANVRVVTGDGSVGVPAFAPYDRILVTAAAPDISATLLQQLRPVPGSKLVAPVGDQQSQSLIVVEWTAQGWVQHNAGSVRFVPLRGEAGWSSTEWKTQ
jgi:protein-L-isoaspartate(D-aspartate) O-methyltransferase